MKTFIGLYLIINSYQTLCGAVDSIADISAHLCHVMGMPPRDWIVGEKRSIDSSDSQKINIPISPGTCCCHVNACIPPHSCIIHCTYLKTLEVRWH